MAGLVTAIRGLVSSPREHVDARDKPRHDALFPERHPTPSQSYDLAAEKGVAAIEAYGFGRGRGDGVEAGDGDPAGAAQRLALAVRGAGRQEDAVSLFRCRNDIHYGVGIEGEAGRGLGRAIAGDIAPAAAELGAA